jgi:hypothetical protein
VATLDALHAHSGHGDNDALYNDVSYELTMIFLSSKQLGGCAHHLAVL